MKNNNFKIIAVLFIIMLASIIIYFSFDQPSAGGVVGEVVENPSTHNALCSSDSDCIHYCFDYDEIDNAESLLPHFVSDYSDGAYCNYDYPIAPPFPGVCECVHIL